MRAGTHRDRTPEETPHGGRKPPKSQEGAGAGTKARRKRAPRQTPRPTPRKGIPRRGDQHRFTPTERPTTPGGAPPNTHRRSKHRTPYGSHQRTPTSHLKPHGECRAHLHGENGPHPQRKLQGTPPHGAPPRPHRQATTPAATRATSQAPEEDEGTATATRTGDRNSRGYGTKAQALREGNPRDRHAVDLPNPPARAARPSPHGTDPARHPHLTAPPSHQPATLWPALRTTTQARLTSTDPPRHNARPRHTAPQRATVQRATARRDAMRHRAAHNDTTDPNLRDQPKQATAHPGRRRTSTPHTSTAGHTRGNSAPSNNGGGPPRRLKPAPQRGKDTNNPSPLTQSHKQPPGAAAQPAEPGPNPARRGAEPTVYIAHPTHGAGTRQKKTQLTTAAPKTTLNAGQCVRQPREGRGRNRQTPPPQKKTKQQRGEGGGAKKTHSHQTARQHHQRRPNPPPEGTEDRTPKEAQGDHQAKTGNTKPETAAHQEKGHRNKQTHTTKKKRKKKKSQQPSPKERGWGDRDHKARDRDTQQKKKKSAKNAPRQPSQEGLGTAETQAQHTRPHRTPEPGTAGGKRGAHATTHVP